jgi:hypothetical protein
MIQLIGTEEMDDYLRTSERIKDAAEKVRLRYIELLKENNLPTEGYPHVNFVKVEDSNHLLYEGDEHWSFGGHEFHRLYLPLAWLTTYDWESEIQQCISIARRDKAMKESREAKEKEVKREESERLHLAMLKAKYPNA